MKTYFAPLEGVTDEIYRHLHHEYYPGIDKYFIPFISPTSQTHITNRELKDISLYMGDGFVNVPQVLTKNPEAFILTARMLEALGYKEVNLNLGCPSGTVTAKGKGAGMLRDLDKLKAFFDVIFANSPIAISVKTRIGFDNADDWPQMIELYNSYPISEIIVHPRTRAEFYKGAVHKEAYAAIYSNIHAKLVYNGDLFSHDDIALIKSSFPKTSALMLGRGLVAHPGLLSGCYDVIQAERFHNALLAAYIEDRPPNAVLGHMCEIMFYMSACFEDSKRYLKRMQKAHSIQEYACAAKSMFEECSLKDEPYFFQ